MKRCLAPRAVDDLAGLASSLRPVASSFQPSHDHLISWQHTFEMAGGAAPRELDPHCVRRSIHASVHDATFTCMTQM